jgi:hypothetical protein
MQAVRENIITKQKSNFNELACILFSGRMDSLFAPLGMKRLFIMTMGTVWMTRLWS